MFRPLAVLLSLLLLPVFTAACLHWVDPEELEPDDDDSGLDDDDSGPDDDDTGPDDDDTGPDDDDTTATEGFEADAIGLIIVNDDPEGQVTGGVTVGALFAEERMGPSAEEAIAEELFGSSMPLFAETGEPRTRPAGDHYDVTGLEVGQPLFVNAGADSVPLGFFDGGYQPIDVFWLPELLDGSAPWTLQVPAGDSDYGGFHQAQALPEAAKPEFPRMVGRRVFLLADEVLAGGTASGDGAWDLLVFHAGEELPATAVRVDPDGSVAVDRSEVAPELVEAGWMALGWYRAARTWHDLDGGLLSLVTGRWTDMDLLMLPAGVGYASTEPVDLQAATPIEFVVRLEGVEVPMDEVPQVQIDGVVAPEIGLLSNTEIEVGYPDGLYSMGTVDVWVSWSGGAAQGATILFYPPLPCDLTEAEPNDLPSQAHFFMPGLVACGTTDPPDDVDNYRFNAVVGTTYAFETLAGRLGHPSDTFLRLVDLTGEELAHDDDGAGYLDSRLIWTAENAGQHILRVEGFANQVGGPGYDYQLITSIE